MSTMGRRDGFLSGAYGGTDGSDPRLAAAVLKATEVMAIPVYCTKNEKHVFPLGKLQKDELCLICKREGIKSDVAVKQAIPAPTFKAAYDDDDEKRKNDGDNDADDQDPNGMLSSGTGLPRRRVTGTRQSKRETYETGGMLDGQPIRTEKNKVRRPWTGTR